jgi:elongation factor G
MPPVLGPVGEPAEPPSELSIHIIVPEEFAGMSMAELNSRRGLITGVDAQTGTVLIRASLPASEYGGLEEAINEGTRHRGRVERASPQ